MSQVANDLRYNLENGLNSKSITITKGEISEVVTGLVVFHNLSFDAESGAPIEGSIIRAIISIDTALQIFPELYKKDNLISMKGYEVIFNTPDGKEIKTKVKSTFPDYTQGAISLICEFKK